MNIRPRLLPALLTLLPLAAQAQLLPGYNSTYYPTLPLAAAGVAQPFLLRQGYARQAGVIVAGASLVYNGTTYAVNQGYQNGGSGYLVATASYAAYGLTAVRPVWPIGMPNVAYNPATPSFDGLGDCVSYVMRVLGATGDTSATGNAYRNLQRTVRAANTTLMAARGYLATAYELGAAFPTLGAGSATGWQYVAGNVVADSLNATNHALRPTVGTYNGVAKGGVAGAQAGDVLAWSYPRSASFNGHLMVLDAAPRLLGADSLRAFMPTQSLANVQALLARFRVYAVSLYDCSGQQAHFRDSRRTVSGIGHGTVLLLASPGGDVPQGFIFGTSGGTGRSIRYDSLGVNCFAIALGRWQGRTLGAAAAASAASPLRVFPNPTHQTVSIELDAADDIRIFSATGQCVYTAAGQAGLPLPIDVSSLVPGLYLVVAQRQGCWQKLLVE